MIRRREMLSVLAAAAASPWWAQALTPMSPAMLRRSLPGTEESLPVIGMGSSGSFEVGADEAAREPLREVLRAFAAGGGRVVDTSPNYGTAEDVLGALMSEQALQPKLFIATKLAASGREAGFAQFADSQRRLQTQRIDLLQVHNLRDWRVQLAVARELKARGEVRYVGLTHYLDSAHAELAEAMKIGRPDVVQINHSIVSRQAERTIYPIAQDLGIAVIANRSFEDGRLFARVKDLALPASAAEFGVASWAQLFLKFVIAHPAVTCVIPATAKSKNLRDNLAAGFGALPDEKTRAAWAAALA
jgi:aryl-alcohol dehydrogenase-like predicted oxidoreductase